MKKRGMKGGRLIHFFTLSLLEEKRKEEKEQIEVEQLVRKPDVGSHMQVPSSGEYDVSPHSPFGCFPPHSPPTSGHPNGKVRCDHKVRAASFTHRKKSSSAAVTRTACDKLTV